MRVLVSNSCKGVVHYLAGKYERHQLIGQLMSPDGWRPPQPWLPYALDNGAYSAWTNGEPWSASAFRQHLERARAATRPPLWCVVPDAVADREGTLALWQHWQPVVSSYGIPAAFAVQDGMTPADVPAAAAVVFVGGTTRWKRMTLETWCRSFPRVHVARINTVKWLWRCHILGAESIDGTGWFHENRWQLPALLDYCGRQAAGEPPPAEYLRTDLWGEETAA